MLADTSQEVKKLDSWDWTIDIWRPQEITCLTFGGISLVVEIAHWKKVWYLKLEDEIKMKNKCEKTGRREEWEKGLLGMGLEQLLWIKIWFEWIIKKTCPGGQKGSERYFIVVRPSTVLTKHIFRMFADHHNCAGTVSIDHKRDDRKIICSHWLSTMVVQCATNPAIMVVQGWVSDMCLW